MPYPTNVIFTKTHDAQPMGEYTPTNIDFAKGNVDFRLKQVWNY